MENKIIYVFDLDDTLLLTPTFSDLISKDDNKIIRTEGEFADFFQKIKTFFLLVFSKEVYFVAMGDYIVVFDNKSKAPLGSEYISYIQDLDKTSMTALGLKQGTPKEVLRAFEVKDDHVVFRSIPGFHENPETIGKVVNDEVFKIYGGAENKMIVTGREIKLKKKIEERLIQLGLELPNYGLYCFPGGGISIQNYKIDTILNSIKENNWTQVHFYEDRKDWLEAAKLSVEKAFPDVVFHSHLITLKKRM